MFRWVWALFHGPGEQRRFLVEVRTVLDLARAGLGNAQLPRQGPLGRDDLINQIGNKIAEIDRMLK